MRPIIIAALLCSTAAAETTVCFSPHGHCEAQVIAEIARAKHSILVQEYQFTLAPVAKALISAHDLGVDVRVILDKSQAKAKTSMLHALLDGGIPVAIDAQHRIAHNKIMVIDGAVIIGGSYNMSTGAELMNAENMTVTRDAALAAKYAANWQLHRAHAQEATK